MRSINTLLFLVVFVQLTYSQDTSPIILSDTIFALTPYDQIYDTIAVTYDNLGREIEQNVVSVISNHNYNSWYKVTTEYDSLGREIGGFIYTLNGDKEDPDYYIQDTIYGIVDTTMVNTTYNTDTIYESMINTNGWHADSYKVVDEQGKTLEEVDLNNIGGVKMRKQILRDSINHTKVTHTEYYKKSGMLKYTETDSIYCDSFNNANYLVNRTTRKRTTKRRRLPSMKCTNCIHYYDKDSLGRITQITKQNFEEDTLALENFEYGKTGKVVTWRKSIPQGRVEDQIYKYDHHGTLVEYKMIKKEKIFIHQIHNIKYIDE